MADSSQPVPQAAPIDPNAVQLLALTGNVLKAIGYPIWIVVSFTAYYLFLSVFFIVKSLLRPIYFLLQPVIYLGHFILQCLAAPFRLLAKLETLYIYLGTAAITGVAIGLAVTYTRTFLNHSLKLDHAPSSTPGRTAKEYRMKKREQKARAEEPLMSPGPITIDYRNLPINPQLTKRGKGLSAQTIMEEMDSDY